MNKYILLSVLVVIIYATASFMLPTGGVVADSLSYFGIAADLPYPATNLFPLGFPALVAFFHLVFQDYFWASKFLFISLTVTILIFSYHQRFFFRETVLLFTGKTFFLSFNIIASEGPFLFLLYFMVYCFYRFFTEKLKGVHFVIGSVFLMIMLFTVRYSAIYVYAGIGVFYFFSLMKGLKLHRREILLFLIFSGVGILVYLGLNYLYFGSLTGEHQRGKPAEMHMLYIYRNITGVANVFNPFIAIKPSSNSTASLLFQGVLALFDVLLLLVFLRFVRKRKKINNKEFHYLLWIMAAVYVIGLYISGWVQQIEEMNTRMLVAANFLLFFSFLIIFFQNLKEERYIFFTGIFFLFFLTVYLLKEPANFLKTKDKISMQMPKFSHKKYLFNDQRTETTITTYEIPVLNKKFRYKHTSLQKGEIKQNIAGMVNPKIKWQKSDTIKNKSQVLYTSQIILK